MGIEQIQCDVPNPTWATHMIGRVANTHDQIKKGKQSAIRITHRSSSKASLLSGYSWFISPPDLSAPPEVRDALAFGYLFVYFADHTERKYVDEDGNKSANQSDYDLAGSYRQRELHGGLLS
jgi:hypothetical protein